MAGTVVAGQKLTAALLGVPAWTAMTLANSWTNTGSGTVAAQYRTWELLNSVECIGAITAGTLTSGTIIATLTDAPASQQYCCVSTGGATAAGDNTPVIYIDTSADLKIDNLPSTTTSIAFHFWYSLDA